jgi:hypothetical protein
MNADAILRKLHDIDYVIDWEAVRAAFGVHRSSKIGAGFRFGGIKPEYVWPSGHPNESASEIYDEEYVTVWHTTRKIPVFILDDLSGSMDFGSGPTKTERAALISASISYSAYISKDDVTYIGFSEKVEPSLHFKSSEFGKDLPWYIANARLSFRGTRKSARGFSEALGYLPANEPSLCFIISDFWPQEMFIPELEAAVEIHDIVPIVLRDVLEEKLPEEAGYASLVDAESGAEVLVPLGLRSRLQEENERLKRAFRQAGIEAIWCGENENDIQRLREFFLRRLQS